MVQTKIPGLQNISLPNNKSITMTKEQIEFIAGLLKWVTDNEYWQDALGGWSCPDLHSEWFETTEELINYYKNNVCQHKQI